MKDPPEPGLEPEPTAVVPSAPHPSPVSSPIESEDAVPTKDDSITKEDQAIKLEAVELTAYHHLSQGFVRGSGDDEDR